MASKPFSKMLGPNFKEGQPNDGSTGKEIPLPADKPSAIELMCNIIHHRIHETSHTPAAIEIHDLAIVSDKYDCIRATALAARAWIHPNSARDTNELGFFLISASIFALPEAFYKVSMSLVINHQGSYKVLEDVPGFIERLGWETIRKLASLTHPRWQAKNYIFLVQLEEKRNSVRQEINKELVLNLNGVSCSWKCDWSAQQLRRWFEHLQAVDLLPVEGSERLSNVISRAECSTAPDSDALSSQCKSARYHRGLDTGSRNHSLTRVMNSSGLCLSD
jgi:hypothetical protein